MAVDLVKHDARVVQPGTDNHVEPENGTTWSDRIVKALPYVSAGLILLVSIVTIIVLVVVSDSGATVSRIDDTAEAQTCRAKFANEREEARAQLEASSADLSAGLATGLVQVIEEPPDEAAILETRASLPLLVADVQAKSDSLITIVEEYDHILDLPEDEFLAACDERF